jgi:peptidyl-dipeptidase Dcp
MNRALILLATMLAMTACTTRQNPFLTEWNTPYGIPPYSEIKNSDYIPAIKEGIKQQQAQVDSITNNPAAPSFENTVAPLELSGDILKKVSGVLFNISETDNSPELQAIVDEATPLITEHGSNMAMNKKLYERIAAIYNGDQSGLTTEQKTIVKKRYEDFKRDGVGLDDEGQAKLRKINSEMASLSNTMGNNILAENNAFKDTFKVTVSAYPTAMTTTADRALREKMFKAYSSRCHNGNKYDNCENVVKMMDLRLQKAKLLGYDSPAAYILEPKMAHDPATVDKFLGDIMTASMKRAKEEVADMQKLMDKDVAAGILPAGSKIQPWDYWYYSEKVRKEKYDLDEELVKPYFELDNVVNGVFEAAHELYGINFEELKDVPSYNPEVRTFKLTDTSGNLIGIFTADYHVRSSKRGGAWMNNVRDQYYDAKGNDVRPIIENVTNFPEADSNGVCLLTVDEVQTAFHEFGHALHGFLSKCHYPSVSGTSVTRDFVETFSQFNENWAFQPELLAKYAKHYKTGEVIPAELVAKINNSLKFNQGFTTGELCAASILDMKWHEITESPLASGKDARTFVDEFEAKACKDMGLIDEIIPRYRTTYFNHIFSSGYSAGYYGYLWAEVLDKDAFAAFEEDPKGVWDPAMAKKFKETFLEKGGSEEPMDLYRSFRGKDPDTKAFLRGRGLE